MFKQLINKFKKSDAKQYAAPALMNSYARLPVSFTRGDGAMLFDTEGREYLDILGGIAVTILGHCHPKISQAISLQATRLLHCSNLFHIQEQAVLGERLCEISAMEKVFFGNSGAEANEAAIKIARLFGHSKKINTPTIVCANGSFHGRSMGALAATGNEALQRKFGPMLAGFIHVNYNDLDAMQALAENPDIVAIMVEPIQGESGVILPDDGYLVGLRELCDKQNWLLIVDEIQSGMGRTGKWFAHQHEQMTPDIITIAKALGNGIPIGACLARGKAANLIAPGDHGTTFGGNPFSCKVALTVLDIMQQENLLQTIENIGGLFKKQLQQKLGAHPKVVDIRGKGLMLAVQLDQAYDNLAQKMLAAGLVVNVTAGGTVIRILPSAVINEAQVKKASEIIQQVVESL